MNNGVVIIKVGLRLIFSLEGKYFDHTTSVTIAEECHKSDTKSHQKEVQQTGIRSQCVCGVIQHIDAEDRAP